MPLRMRLRSGGLISCKGDRKGCSSPGARVPTPSALATSATIAVTGRITRATTKTTTTADRSTAITNKPVEDHHEHGVKMPASRDSRLLRAQTKTGRFYTCRSWRESTSVSNKQQGITGNLARRVSCSRASRKTTGIYAMSLFWPERRTRLCGRSRVRQSDSGCG
jgi:hypothetical protein